MLGLHSEARVLLLGGRGGGRVFDPCSWGNLVEATVFRVGHCEGVVIAGEGGEGSSGGALGGRGVYSGTIVPLRLG